MRKLILVLFAAMTVCAFAADTTVKGYLVDLLRGGRGQQARFWRQA